LADCVAQTTEVAKRRVVRKAGNTRAMIEECPRQLQGLSTHPRARLGNPQLVFPRVLAEQKRQVLPPGQLEMR
jgi:hypothetical protein